jgi:small subunit ribosomal protein S18
MSDNLTNGENAEEVQEVEAAAETAVETPVEATEEAVGAVAVEAAAEAAAVSEAELVADAAAEDEPAEDEPAAAASTTAERPAAASAADADDDDADDEEESPADSRAVEPQRTGPSNYVESEGGRPSRIGAGIKVSEIDYKNIALLSRFLDRRGRILSRRKTRVSAKVQRRVAQAIKRARHLALLPYTSDQTRVVRKRR